MSIEQTEVIDFISIDEASGVVLLTISDHLSWDEIEGEHLVLLQEKLNGYLRYIESGRLFTDQPAARGARIVINLVGKFPLSRDATAFVSKAGAAIELAGFRLQFS